ncbi:MAG: hypothetical protein ACJ74O_06090 [Frankiaceae bacterium]
MTLYDPTSGAVLEERSAGDDEIGSAGGSGQVSFNDGEVTFSPAGGGACKDWSWDASLTQIAGVAANQRGDTEAAWLNLNDGQLYGADDLFGSSSFDANQLPSILAAAFDPYSEDIWWLQAAAGSGEHDEVAVVGPDGSSHPYRLPSSAYDWGEYELRFGPDGGQPTVWAVEDLNNGSLELTPSGQVHAFERDVPPNPDYLNIDKLPASNYGIAKDYIRLSDDRTSAAFVAFDYNSREESLWTAPASGGEPTQVTSFGTPDLSDAGFRQVIRYGQVAPPPS